MIYIQDLHGQTGTDQAHELKEHLEHLWIRPHIKLYP